MDFTRLFKFNKKNMLNWTWKEFYEKRKQLKTEGIEVYLVDTRNNPVTGSVPFSNDLFQTDYPEGAYFAVYCNTGRSSKVLQRRLASQFPQYNIVNIEGGFSTYEAE